MTKKENKIIFVSNREIFQKVNNLSTSGGGNLVQHRYNYIRNIWLNKHKEFSIFNTRFLYAFFITK